ncbi:ATP-binding cassette domain-containing protein [Actinokineospora pegani]|uniref:ATP-binding cassette domain-containing protein n=1 Tax=Actinokineospora pegani TaxID=2654637 RepID=UPI0012EA2150|nr:ATP-binding cassette domain-containing protein [Actinokineospora pegani]
MSAWDALRELLALSWRADRRSAWTTVVVFSLCHAAVVAASVSIAVMVASWAGDDLTTAAVFLGLACAALVAQVLLGRYSIAVSTAVVDATNRLVDEDLQRALYGSGSIEHFSEREFTDDLQIVRSEQARLTEGADVLGLILGTGLRLGAVVALTALATPWLLLMPIAAAGAYLCVRKRDAAVGAGQRAAAQDASACAELAAIGTDDKHTAELLLSRGGDYLLAAHREAADAAEAARAAGLRRGAMWTVLGAVLTSAALAAGTAGLVDALAAGSTGLTATLASLLLLSTTTTLVAALARYLTSCADSLRVVRSLARVRERLRRDPGTPRVSGPVSALELRGVSYRYPGSETPALDDVSLRLEQGRVHAIVGANGSGKTTLVTLLSGLIRPSSGELVPHGADPAAGPGPTCVAQDSADLEFELRDAVALGDPRFTDDDVERALGGAGLGDLADRAGLALPLGATLPHGRRLSSGQWQRVALARGLLRADAPLLLFDEPTAAIDPVAEEELLDRLLETVRGCRGIAVVVTHRMSLAPAADTVILLERGRVAAVGPHERLLDVPAYARLYNAQRAGYLDDEQAR